MRFYLRKKRQPPAVIIVALIDVLIVVLIFLMVTTTFKKAQPALKLALPESSQATKSGVSENPPLVVIIEEDGNLRLGPEAKPVTVDRLKSELLAEIGKNPQLKLTLNADKKAPFGQIVKVMDAAKEAKIKTISAFTKQSGQP
ncbi:MAG: exbD [Pedosphaera sp.]|jgi:biopolymer transport protein ExbD|nr:exbD [Pedosphaera sp.]